MATAREIIELVLKRMLAGGSRVAGAANILMGSVGENGATTSGYPEEFAPGAYHTYSVLNIPRPNGHEGKWYQNMNQHGRADAATIAEAAEQQSIEEHEEAINQFVKLLPKNATPAQVQAALNRGREAEKRLPKWWNESENRRKFSVSSSAVDGIRITPEGTVQVKWAKSPTWYTFKQYPNTHEASKAVRELLEMPSIGRAVYPVVSQGTGPRMSKDKTNPGMLGEWNNRNYEAGFAG